MSVHFPRDFIDHLLSKADIVDLIDKRITLKKSGNNYSACCPFHTEKNPSFIVSQHKQFYYCFGCKAHGNAISFLMAYDRLEFIEAVEALANFLGLPIPEPSSSETHKTQHSSYRLLEEVAHYYRAQLSASSAAQAYLHKRGLTADIIDRFNIGFAPAGWNQLLQRFGRSVHVQKLLLETGMLVQKSSGQLFDRFRERIIIPIRNPKGQVIAFGGRSLGERLPKYLNSPETPLFHKGNELFGWYELKQQRSDLTRIIVVEGYLDVIALHQFGMTQAVATLGTATTVQHLQRLCRLTSEIVFCFDGDKAGQSAAWRALETMLPQVYDGLQVRFMFLPENQDPDSCVRQQGIATFQSLLEQALPLPDFFFNHLMNQINVQNLDGKAKLAKLGRDYISQIRNGIFQELMLAKLADLVGTSLNKLNALQFEQSSRRVSFQGRQDIHLSKHQNKERLTPLQFTLAAVLQYPNIAQAITILPEFDYIKLPGIPTLLKLIQLLKANSGLTTGMLLEHFRNHKMISRLARLASVELLVIPSKEQVEEAMLKIVQMNHERQIQQLMERGNQQSLTESEKKQLLELLKKHKSLERN